MRQISPTAMRRIAVQDDLVAAIIKNRLAQPTKPKG